MKALERFSSRSWATKRRVAAAVALAGLVGLPAGPAAHAQEPLTVYSSLPHVGDSERTSDDMVLAARMALADRGGQVAGHPVTLVSRNDGSRRSGQWEASRTATNARKAATDDTSIAYLGELNSGASVISSPITNEGGLLHVSPANAAVGLTRAVRGLSEPGEPDKYMPAGVRTFGRIAPTDLVVAGALADYVRQLGIRRVVLVHDGGLYGRGLHRVLRNRLREIGVSVAGRARTSKARARRVARTLDGVRAQAMVFTGIAGNGAAALWRRVARSHPRWKLIGSDGVAISSFTTRLTRKAAARTYVTQVPLAPDSYPAAGQAFHARFLQEQGRMADPWAIFGYEAMAVVLDAIERADDPTSRTDVIDAFFATRDRASVLGDYSIDRFGDTTLSTYGGYRVRRDGAIVWDRVLDSSPS